MLTGYLVGTVVFSFGCWLTGWVIEDKAETSHPWQHLLFGLLWPIAVPWFLFGLVLFYIDERKP